MLGDPAVLFFPAHPTVLWASDSTAYVNFGRQISKTGTLVFADQFLTDMTPETRQALFRNSTSGDATGTYARFPGGFLIPDISDNKVTAGFSPLFPVLMALGHQLFSTWGALIVAPLFAVLSIGAMYLVGVRLNNTLTGLLSATLLAISVPQIWFAKFSLPAVVSQFFVLAGLLALLVALRGRHTLLGGHAGWLFGTAMFAKFDLVAVLPVSVLAFLAVGLLSASRFQRMTINSFALAFCVPLCHNAVHFLIFPSHYAPFVQRTIQTSYLLGFFSTRIMVSLGIAVLAAMLLLVVRGVLVTQAWNSLYRARTLASVLCLVLLGYAINYLNSSENRLNETVAWLGWSLSWPILGVLVVGVFFLLRNWYRERDLKPVCVLILLGVACLHYLYDPHEPSELIWSIRRFVPIVIPLTFLVVSVFVADVLHRVSRRHRWWITAAVCAVLVTIVGRPTAAIVGKPLWSGAIEQSEQIASLFPPGSVVLVSPELSGTHLQTSLAYLHDRDAVLLQRRYNDPLLLETVIREWLEAGKNVFVIFGDQDFQISVPRLSASSPRDVVLELPMLETTLSRLPQAVIVRTLPLRIIEVTSSMSPRQAFDVGTPTDDVLFHLQGFYEAERDPDPSRGTYRWFGEVASIRIPAEEVIQVSMDGWRPAGVAAAEVSIWVGGQLVAQDLTLPRSPTTVTLANPAAQAGGVTDLQIRSTVFSPQRVGLSNDDRTLGARIYRVEFRGRE